MRRCVLAFSLLLLACIAFAQQASITGFTVKHELPGDISQWKADAVNALLQGSSTPGAVSKPIKLVLQIRKGSAMACGNSMQSAQAIDNLTAKPIRTSDVIAILGNCTLQPGQYSLCIQLFSADNRSIAEQCREFTVADEKTAYQPPTLVAPANNTVLTLAELKKPITFRWTPVVPPPPANNVVYHLHVYEVLPGQVAAQAIKTNNPVF